MKGRGRSTVQAASSRPLGIGRGLMTPGQFRQGSRKAIPTPTNDSLASLTCYPGKVIQPVADKHLPCQDNAKGECDRSSNVVISVSADVKEELALSSIEPDAEAAVRKETIHSGQQNYDLQEFIADGVNSPEPTLINTKLPVDSYVQPAETGISSLRNEVDEKTKLESKLRNEVAKVTSDLQGLNGFPIQPSVNVGKSSFGEGCHEMEDAEAEWKRFKLEREFNRILNLFNDEEDLQHLVGKFENIIKESPLGKSSFANSELDIALDVLLTKVKNKRLKVQHNIKILKDLADCFPSGFKSSFPTMFRETQSRLITVAASDTILTKSAEKFCSFLGQLYAQVLAEKSWFQAVVSECVARFVEDLTYPDGIDTFIEGHQVNVVETHARALQILFKEVAAHHPHLPSEADLPTEFSVFLERTKESVLNASLPRSVRELFLDGLLSFNPWFAAKLPGEKSRLQEPSAHNSQEETFSMSDCGASSEQESSAPLISVASPSNLASRQMATDAQSDLCTEVQGITDEPNDLNTNKYAAAGPDSVITSSRREHELEEKSAPCHKDQQPISFGQDMREHIQQRKVMQPEVYDPDNLDGERSPSPVRGISLLRAAVMEKAGDTEISDGRPAGLDGEGGHVEQKNSSRWLGFGRGMTCSVRHGHPTALGLSRNEEIAADYRETCKEDKSEGKPSSGSWVANRGYSEYADADEYGESSSSGSFSFKVELLDNINDVASSPKGNRKTVVTGEARSARTPVDDMGLSSSQEGKDSRDFSTSNGNFRSIGRGFESKSIHPSHRGPRERTPERRGLRTARGSRRGVSKHSLLPVSGGSSESRSGKSGVAMQETRSSSPLFGMGQQPSCFKCGSKNHVTSNCVSKESFFF